MLVTFQSNEIDKIWPKIEPLIKKVLNKTELYCTINSIKDSLKREEMQLWTSYNGTQLETACVTRILIHPKYKSLEIILISGKAIAIPFIKEVEKWAKSLGCKKVEIEGRKGWIKVLPDYCQKVIKLEKEL